MRVPPVRARRFRGGAASGAWPLLAVVMVALIPRLLALRWGLPDVLEEATPLRKAWEMWGWGPARPVDLNPHFFNYPTLTFYLQFVAQAILYAWLRVTGAVHSTLDFRVLYVTDPTPFLVAGRVVTVLFAAGTVAILYAIGRRIAGTAGAVIAAGLLALNPVHLAQSVVVEVDVPLTFFVALTILAALRLAETPARGRYLLAGAAAGLAASTKYPGAIAFAAIIAAHALARGRRRDLALSLAAAAAAFALTSPFVLIDAREFWRDFATEREHMSAGHFGLATTPAWRWYADALAGRLLGWPVIVAALASLVWFGAVKRRPWALIIAAFLAPFAITLGSWSMRGDRYALPLVASAIAAGAGGVAELIASRSRRARLAIAAAALLAAGPVRGYGSYRDRLETAAHSMARRWIETHVPAGAMIVSEMSGPRLIGPLDLAPLEPDLRARIAGGTARVYAVLFIPMFQVEPERSAAFYDLDLYRAADCVVIVSQVAERYRADPARFPRQLEFYARLAREFETAAVFQGAGGRGGTVTIYRSAAGRAPFAARTRVAGPVPLRAAGAGESGEETFFYYQLALDYELFGFPQAALAAYSQALRYSTWRPGIFGDVVLGTARCLALAGRRGEVDAFLAEAESRAANAIDREAIRRARGR